MNTSPSPSDDPLEALLKNNSAPIPDDGFTVRVLSALPPPEPKPRRKLNQRQIACGLGALVGVIVACTLSGTPRIDDLHALGSTMAPTLAKLQQYGTDWPTLTATTTIIGCSLIIAFYREIIEKFDRQ